MNKCFGCNSTITKYNTKSYKGFCCRRLYNINVKEKGKKSADMVEASSKRVVNRLNSSLKKKAT